VPYWIPCFGPHRAARTAGYPPSDQLTSVPHRVHGPTACTPFTELLARSVKSNNSLILGSIESALDALKSQTDVNYTETARDHGIVRTTLMRRHKGITASKTAANERSRLLSTREGAC
jgi:hypothetical protein